MIIGRINIIHCRKNIGLSVFLTRKTAISRKRSWGELIALLVPFRNYRTNFQILVLLIIRNYLMHYR